MLVSKEARGKSLATHLLVALLDMFPKSPRVRLQVKDENVGAIMLYSNKAAIARKLKDRDGNLIKVAASWDMTEWRAPASTQSYFYGVEAAAGCSFMAGTRKAVHNGASGLAGARPLSDNVTFWRSAATPIDNVVLDHVGIPNSNGNDDGDDDPPDLTADAAAAAGDADMGDATPTGEAPDELAREQAAAAGNARFENDEEEMHDDAADEAPNAPTAPTNPAVKPSAGAEALIDAVNLVLVTSGEVVSEGDPAQFPGFKTTGDKASLQNAPKAQKGCTSLQLQHLCNGVRNGDWSNSVKYMVTQPQSCLRAFVLRLWFGNDDAANMEAHGAPVMEEGVKLEDGVDLDLPMQRVPWFYVRAPFLNGNRGAGTLHLRPLDEEKGTAANRRKGNVREWLITKVRIWPAFMFAFDGATHLANARVSLRSNHADPYTNTHTDDMGSFHCIYYLKCGRSLTDVAEELLPGSSEPNSSMHWFVTYLCSLNAWSKNSDLQAVTREPPRQEHAPRVGDGIGKQAKKVAKLVNNQMEEGGDGRTDQRLPYKNADIVRCGYDHDKFVPAINGDAPDVATETLDYDVLIRAPVMTTMFERKLENTIWKDEAACSKQNFIERFGLCIIHCAMRTLESCIRQIVSFASTRYKAGKGKDREIINTHLNVAVWEDVRLRKLISVNQKGELNKVTLNGEEVTAPDPCRAPTPCRAPPASPHPHARIPWRRSAP